MSVKYLNNQKYSECQLVTAINAASYLGEPIVLPNTPEYDRLVDYMEGSKDAGIYEKDIRQAYKYLRVGYYRIHASFKEVKKALELNHPVEVNFYKSPYMHSALIVDYSVDMVKIPNSGLKNDNGWIRWKDLYKRIVVARNKLSSIFSGDINFYKLRAFYKREPRIEFTLEE